MSEPNASKQRASFPWALLGGVAFLVLLVLLCGGAWMLLGRDELLATFSVGSYGTLNIYAEPEFLYEPPGYIYFDLKQSGQTVVPRRRFMGIGYERKPQHNFTVLTADDQNIIALLLNNEVQMIHECSSGFTWPGPYTNVTESQWEMAELALQRLRAANPDILCPRQMEYRKELDRSRPR